MKIVSVLSICAVAAVSAVPAEATQSITYNGTTALFSNDKVTSPAFTDTYNLGTFGAGAFLFSGTVTSSYSNPKTQDLNFTSVTLDGQEFSIGSSGVFEFRFINGLPSMNPNTLILKGTAGTAANYSGQLTISAATSDVPEPASWALMVGGFALAGGALRANRRPRTDVSFG